MPETMNVTILRRVLHLDAEEAEIELLRFRVPYGENDEDVVALGLFHNPALAERYLDERTGGMSPMYLTLCPRSLRFLPPLRVG